MRLGIKKVISVLVVLTMLSETCFAQVPGLTLNFSAKPESLPLAQIEIPAELASVEEFWEAPTGKNSKVILQIQNAHTNYEAQAKIRDLIAYLEKNYGFKTIFVEGAAENLNPDYLRLFPDAETNRKLWDELAKRGQITGADWFLLESSERGLSLATKSTGTDPYGFERAKGTAPMRGQSPASEAKGVGIEDAELYRQNYEALKAVFGRETETTRFVSGLESELDKLATKLLDPEIRKIISEWKKFEKGHREFLPFVAQLEKWAKEKLGLDLRAFNAQIDQPQLTRLLVLQDMERGLSLAAKQTGTDPNGSLESKRTAEQAAKVEKQAMIQFLKSKNVSKELIEGLERFNEKDINMNRIRAGGAGAQSLPRFFIEKLVEEAGPKGLKFSEYPNFALYAGYLILKYEIEPNALFGEIRNLFDQLLAGSVLSDSAGLTPVIPKEHGGQSPQGEDSPQALIALFRDAELMRKLLNLELSRDEWQQTLIRKDELQPEQIFKRVRGLSLDAKQAGTDPNGSLESKGTVPMREQSPYQQQILTAFESAFEFYDLAIRRDEVFYGRMAKELETTDRAILMTGGFHTEGLKEKFRENQISYGTLTPRLTQIEKSNLYREVMLGKIDAVGSVPSEARGLTPVVSGTDVTGTDPLPTGQAGNDSSSDSTVEIISRSESRFAQEAQGASLRVFFEQLRAALSSIGISRAESKSAILRYEANINGADELKAGNTDRFGMGPIDRKVSGVILRVHGEMPEGVLKKIAATVKEAHAEIPRIVNNCKQCSELFSEKAVGIVGLDESSATIIGSDSLHAVAKDVVRPSDWKAPIVWSNHWLGYIVVGGLHIAVDLTAKSYLGSEGIDAEIFVGHSREELERQLEVYYGGDKWKDENESRKLALLHKINVDGHEVDLERLRRKQIIVFFTNPDGVLQAPVAGKLMDYSVDSNGDIYLSLGLGGIERTALILKNRQLTESERNDPWEASLPSKILKEIFVDDGRELTAKSRSELRKGVIPYSSTRINWKEVFGNSNELIVEVGPQDAKLLHALAGSDSGSNYIGVEVQGANDREVRRLGDQPNLKMVYHDARDVLETMFADNEVSMIHIFFPMDPLFPDGARLIGNNSEFVTALFSKLRGGGKLKIVTESSSYANAAIKILGKAGFVTKLVDISKDETSAQLITKTGVDLRASGNYGQYYDDADPKNQNYWYVEALKPVAPSDQGKPRIRSEARKGESRAIEDLPETVLSQAGITQDEFLERAKAYWEETSRADRTFFTETARLGIVIRENNYLQLSKSPLLGAVDAMKYRGSLEEYLYANIGSVVVVQGLNNELDVYPMSKRTFEANYAQSLEVPVLADSEELRQAKAQLQKTDLAGYALVGVQPKHNPVELIQMSKLGFKARGLVVQAPFGEQANADPEDWIKVIPQEDGSFRFYKVEQNPVTGLPVGHRTVRFEAQLAEVIKNEATNSEHRNSDQGAVVSLRTIYPKLDREMLEELASQAAAAKPEEGMKEALLGRWNFPSEQTDDLFYINDQGQVLGHIVFAVSEKNPTASIGRFGVKEEFHGAGVGTFMLDVLFKRLEQQGADYLEIPAESGAVSFYQDYLEKLKLTVQDYQSISRSDETGFEDFTVPVEAVNKRVRVARQEPRTLFSRKDSTQAIVPDLVLDLDDRSEAREKVVFDASEGAFAEALASQPEAIIENWQGYEKYSNSPEAAHPIFKIYPQLNGLIEELVKSSQKSSALARGVTDSQGEIEQISVLYYPDATGSIEGVLKIEIKQKASRSEDVEKLRAYQDGFKDKGASYLESGEYAKQGDVNTGVGLRRVGRFMKNFSTRLQFLMPEESSPALLTEVLIRLVPPLKTGGLKGFEDVLSMKRALEGQENLSEKLKAVLAEVNQFQTSLDLKEAIKEAIAVYVEAVNEYRAGDYAARSPASLLDPNYKNPEGLEYEAPDAWWDLFNNKVATLRFALPMALKRGDLPDRSLQAVKENMEIVFAMELLRQIIDSGDVTEKQTIEDLFQNARSETRRSDRLFRALFLAIALSGPVAGAQQLVWDPVTNAMDGTAIQAGYKVFRGEPGTGDFKEWADVGTNTFFSLDGVTHTFVWTVQSYAFGNPTNLSGIAEGVVFTPEGLISPSGLPAGDSFVDAEVFRFGDTDHFYFGVGNTGTNSVGGRMEILATSNLMSGVWHPVKSADVSMEQGQERYIKLPLEMGPKLPRGMGSIYHYTGRFDATNAIPRSEARLLEIAKSILKELQERRYIDSYLSAPGGVGGALRDLALLTAIFSPVLAVMAGAVAVYMGFSPSTLSNQSLLLSSSIWTVTMLLTHEAAHYGTALLFLILERPRGEEKASSYAREMVSFSGFISDAVAMALLGIFGVFLLKGEPGSVDLGLFLILGAIIYGWHAVLSIFNDVRNGIRIRQGKPIRTIATERQAKEGKSQQNDLGQSDKKRSEARENLGSKLKKALLTKEASSRRAALIRAALMQEVDGSKDTLEAAKKMRLAAYQIYKFLLQSYGLVEPGQGLNDEQHKFFQESLAFVFGGNEDRSYIAKANEDLNIIRIDTVVDYATHLAAELGHAIETMVSRGAPMHLGIQEAFDYLSQIMVVYAIGEPRMMAKHEKSRGRHAQIGEWLYRQTNGFRFEGYGNGESGGLDKPVGEIQQREIESWFKRNMLLDNHFDFLTRLRKDQGIDNSNNPLFVGLARDAHYGYGHIIGSYIAERAITLSHGDLRRAARLLGQSLANLSRYSIQSSGDFLREIEAVSWEFEVKQMPFWRLMWEALRSVKPHQLIRGLSRLMEFEYRVIRAGAHLRPELSEESRSSDLWTKDLFTRLGIQESTKGSGFFDEIKTMYMTEMGFKFVRQMLLNRTGFSWKSLWYSGRARFVRQKERLRNYLIRVIVAKNQKINLTVPVYAASVLLPKDITPQRSEARVNKLDKILAQLRAEGWEGEDPRKSKVPKFWKGAQAFSEEVKRMDDDQLGDGLHEVFFPKDESNVVPLNKSSLQPLAGKKFFRAFIQHLGEPDQLIHYIAHRQEMEAIKFAFTVNPKRGGEAVYYERLAKYQILFVETLKRWSESPARSESRTAQPLTEKQIAWTIAGAVGAIGLFAAALTATPTLAVLAFPVLIYGVMDVLKRSEARIQRFLKLNPEGVQRSEHRSSLKSGLITTLILLSMLGGMAIYIKKKIDQLPSEPVYSVLTGELLEEHRLNYLTENRAGVFEQSFSSSPLHQCVFALAYDRTGKKIGAAHFYPFAGQGGVSDAELRRQIENVIALFESQGVSVADSEVALFSSESSGGYEDSIAKLFEETARKVVLKSWSSAPGITVSVNPLEEEGRWGIEVRQGAIDGGVLEESEIRGGEWTAQDSERRSEVRGFRLPGVFLGLLVFAASAVTSLGKALPESGVNAGYHIVQVALSKKPLSPANSAMRNIVFTYYETADQMVRNAKASLTETQFKSLFRLSKAEMTPERVVQFGEVMFNFNNHESLGHVYFSNKKSSARSQAQIIKATREGIFKNPVFKKITGVNVPMPKTDKEWDYFLIYGPSANLYRSAMVWIHLDEHADRKGAKNWSFNQLAPRDETDQAHVWAKFYHTRPWSAEGIKGQRDFILRAEKAERTLDLAARHFLDLKQVGMEKPAQVYQAALSGAASRPAAVLEPALESDDVEGPPDLNIDQDTVLFEDRGALDETAPQVEGSLTQKAFLTVKILGINAIDTFSSIFSSEETLPKTFLVGVIAIPAGILNSLLGLVHIFQKTEKSMKRLLKTSKWFVFWLVVAEVGALFFGGVTLVLDTLGMAEFNHQDNLVGIRGLLYLTSFGMVLHSALWLIAKAKYEDTWLRSFFRVISSFLKLVGMRWEVTKTERKVDRLRDERGRFAKSVRSEMREPLPLTLEAGKTYAITLGQNGEYQKNEVSADQIPQKTQMINPGESGVIDLTKISSPIEFDLNLCSALLIFTPAVLYFGHSDFWDFNPLRKILEMAPSLSSESAAFLGWGTDYQTIQDYNFGRAMTNERMRLLDSLKGKEIPSVFHLPEANQMVRMIADPDKKMVYVAVKNKTRSESRMRVRFRDLLSALFTKQGVRFFTRGSGLLQPEVVIGLKNPQGVRDDQNIEILKNGLLGEKDFQDFKDIAGKIADPENKEWKKPMVWKPNGLAGGMGILFIEPQTDGTIVLKMADVSDFIRDKRGLIQNTIPSYVQQSGAGTVDYSQNEKGVMRIRLNSNRVPIAESLYKIWQINAEGYKDGGMLESKMDLYHFEDVNGKHAVETRFFMSIDLKEGKEIRLRKGIPDLSSMAGEPSYTRIGASEEFANVGGRDKAQTDVLYGEEMYVPLNIPQGQQQAFAIETEGKMREFAEYVRRRLLALLEVGGQEIPDVRIQIEADVFWLTPSDLKGLPRLGINEVNLSSGRPVDGLFLFKSFQEMEAGFKSQAIYAPAEEVVATGRSESRKRLDESKAMTADSVPEIVVNISRNNRFNLPIDISDWTINRKAGISSATINVGGKEIRIYAVSEPATLDRAWNDFRQGHIFINIPAINAALRRGGMLEEENVSTEVVEAVVNMLAVHEIAEVLAYQLKPAAGVDAAHLTALKAQDLFLSELSDPIQQRLKIILKNDLTEQGERLQFQRSESRETAVEEKSLLGAVTGLPIRSGEIVHEVGAGAPSKNQTVESLLGRGVFVRVFEPDAAQNSNWKSRQKQYARILTVHTDYQDFASKVDEGRVAAVVMMSVLSDPGITSATKKKILDQVVSMLKSGGYLITGHYAVRDEKFSEAYAALQQNEIQLHQAGLDYLKTVAGLTLVDQGQDNAHNWQIYKVVSKTPVKKAEASMVSSRVRLGADGQVLVRAEDGRVGARVLAAVLAGGIFLITAMTGVQKGYAKEADLKAYDQIAQGFQRSESRLVNLLRQTGWSGGELSVTIDLTDSKALKTMNPMDVDAVLAANSQARYGLVVTDVGADLTEWDFLVKKWEGRFVVGSGDASAVVQKMMNTRGNTAAFAQAIIQVTGDEARLNALRPEIQKVLGSERTARWIAFNADDVSEHQGLRVAKTVVAGKAESIAKLDQEVSVFTADASDPNRWKIIPGKLAELSKIVAHLLQGHQAVSASA